MRVDLSKITFVAIKENISEFEIGDHYFTTSNRQHTLLFQSSRKIRTTTTTTSSESSINYNTSKNVNDLDLQTTKPSQREASNRPEMSKLTFINIFDSHKPDEIEKLDSLYADCKGNLPSRRQLSAIAQSIGIQQSKIKKWFEKRKQEQEQEQENCKYSQIDNENKFWDDLDKKLDFIDNEINEIRKNN